MVRRILLSAAFSVTVLSTANAGEPPVPSPSASPPLTTAETATSIDADGALALLKDGNARFVQGESTFPNLDQDRRCLTTEGGQHPYAAILSCADSRVPPELIFDAGIGELFTVRVAGNVADTDEIGTLEYGTGHLHTPLIVVIGHTKCGAVTAVVQHAHATGSVPKLIDNIEPAVETAREKFPGTPEAKLIQLAIKENVRQSMADILRNSAEIRELVVEDKVKIVGAVYDIHNGTIEWLGELPNQSALLDGAAAEHGGETSHDPVVAKHSEEAKHADAEPTEAKPPVDNAHATNESHAPRTEKAQPHDEHAVTAAVHRAAKVEADPHNAAKPKKAEAESEHDSKKSETPGEHVGSAEGDQESHGKLESHEAIGEDSKSLVQKHGLIVPAVFLGAGSVLSGTIVFMLKGKSAPAKPEPKTETPAKH